MDIEEKKRKVSERKKLYYLKNKEKILKQKKELYKNHREKLLERDKKSYQKRKEKISKIRKDYYVKNREKVLLYSKNYRQENKEKIKKYFQGIYKPEKSRLYRQNNLQKIKEYRKSDRGKMLGTISSWKFQGLKDDYEKIYRRYEYTLFCDECRCDLDQCTKSTKCMDHDHETGLFRNILCIVCNIKRG